MTVSLIWRFAKKLPKNCGSLFNAIDNSNAIIILIDIICYLYHCIAYHGKSYQNG